MHYVVDERLVAAFATLAAILVCMVILEYRPVADDGIYSVMTRMVI